MFLSEEIIQPKLDRQTAAEKREEVDGGENARSGSVKPFVEESTIQKSDQQESVLQGPDQQADTDREKKEDRDNGASSRPAMSSSEESTLAVEELRKEKTEVDDREIPETDDTADEEGLLSQITDLIAVLQECDEVDQLVLRNTGMTDSLLQLLMPAIIASKSEVECINLNLNEIGPRGAESLVQLLRKKPGIQSLLLYGNQLGDKGIKTLLCGLSEIHNRHQQVDTPVPYNPPLVQLSELDIGGNHMSDGALRYVADYLKLNPFLKQLGLAHIPVRALAAWQELFDALKINTNLTHLLLDENGLGDTGARLVAEVIQVNRSLLTIDLDGNDIGEEGGKAIAGSLASTKDKTVTTISLDSNHISEGILAEIQTLLMIKRADQ